MSLSRRAALTLVLAAAAVAAGCHRDPSAQLVGTWELTNPDAGGTSVRTREFRADGTYVDTGDHPDPGPATHDTWKLEKEGVLRCYSDGAPVGVYVIEISGDTLTFKTGQAGYPDHVYRRK